MIKRMGTCFMFLMLTACVTINVYFPEAKAREAAEKNVKEIMGLQKEEAAKDSQSSNLQLNPQQILASVVDFVFPTAHAASPGEEKIKAVLRQRFPQLEPFLAAGAIGFTQDGLLAIKDMNAVAPKDKGKVKSLVNADNNDRNALYKESARALGNPKWEDKQRKIYAQEWIKQAKQKGYFYKDASGNWVK